jgi:hypothetical protein
MTEQPVDSDLAASDQVTSNQGEPASGTDDGSGDPNIGQPNDQLPPDSDTGSQPPEETVRDVTDDAGSNSSTDTDAGNQTSNPGSGDGSAGSTSGPSEGGTGGSNTINTPQYDVPALTQPSDMTCWATVATMMISWQDSVSYDIPTVMDRAGAIYRSKFDTNKGLRGSEKQPFLDVLNLRSEPPQDYAVVGMQRLIGNYGPLWVTTDESPDEHFAIHARIVTGMTGDGSADGTMLTIIDPADGQVHTESYNNFTQKFDRVAFDDMNTSSDFRVQVVHF